MIKPNKTQWGLSLMAIAAALALGACQRNDQTAANDTSTSGKTSTAPSTGTASTTPSSDMNNAAATSGTGTTAGSAKSADATSVTSTSGTGSTAPLAPADQQFVTKAAEGGMFEVEIGKLAAEKAADANVKSFAQMLVDDHSAANDKLRQIASGHNVALPASLSDDQKKELDQLSKLSGAQFDKQFVKVVGIKDHHHDIAEFERASKSAQSPDVKDFATNALPTLKKHLAAAEKLPSKG